MKKEIFENCYNESMTLERAAALLLSLPVLTGIAAFVLGLLIPAPAKVQFHQAQAFLLGGLFIGLINATLIILFLASENRNGQIKRADEKSSALLISDALSH